MEYVFIFIFFINIFLHIKCDNVLKIQLTSGNTTLSGNTTEAPFNEITGYASTNVPAYSNGNDTYISDESYYLYGVYTGIKWQCVEYARRWLFIRKGCIFDSVVGAADIWTQINNVQRVVDEKCFSLKQHPNGSPYPPINESLLIYNRSGEDMPFGHVAIIVDVLPGFIRVAEENYYPYYWSGNYSRQIQYVFINGSYYIEDDYPISGWMTVEDNNQTKPLDQATINAIIQLNGTSPNFICSNNGNITDAPFNQITGYASTNVPAYSNGNDSYISHEYYYLYGVFMGIKWQCVEYARRWLFIRKGCVFNSVVGAADIWTQIQYIQRVVDGKCFSLKQHPNGSPLPPINESLLIYTRSGVDMPYGHVAIIVDVLPGFIRVAEENYYPYYWSGNYSRQIQYILKNGGYYIEDEDPIFGWMTIEDHNQTKPLDQTTIDAIIQLNGTSPNFICSNNAIHHRFSIYYYLIFVFMCIYSFS